MDFLMESGFMHWMSERMSFTNWVKADFHETSRMTLKFSAPPRLRERYRLGAGKMMGIALVDHIIITEKSHYSFADNGRLCNN